VSELLPYSIRYTCMLIDQAHPIMLGRLKMSIRECIDAYTSLSDRIFQKKKRRVTVKGNIQGRLDSEELERAIKDVITGQGLEKDALLQDASDEACKV